MSSVSVVSVVDEGSSVVVLMGGVDDVVVVPDPASGRVLVVVGAGSTVVSDGEVVVVVTGTRTAGTSSVCGAGSGRTARYSTDVDTNAPAIMRVDLRGRPITLPRAR